MEVFLCLLRFIIREFENIRAGKVCYLKMNTVNTAAFSHTDHVVRKLLPCMAKCQRHRQKSFFLSMYLQKRAQKKCEKLLFLLVLAMKLDGVLFHNSKEIDIKENIKAALENYNSKDYSFSDAYVYLEQICKHDPQTGKSIISRVLFAN